MNPTAFYQIPGSPFAYWVSEHIRKLFADLPSFGGGERTVKQGLATADDFRFVRTWWEIPPTKIVNGTLETTPEEFNKWTFFGKRWVPFSKGGAYSPYYADLQLVVNWERDGEEIKSRINPESERPYSNVWQLKGTEHGYFFRQGLTWPLRTNGLSFRIMPYGCIFGHKGPTAFVMNDNPVTLLALVAVMNSSSFYLFVKMLVARVSLAQSFEVGLIQSIPIPNFSDADLIYLSTLAHTCTDEKRILDSSNENSHVFYLAKLLQVTGNTLIERITAWQKQVVEAMHQLEGYQNEIDNIASHLYGLQKTDIQEVEGVLQSEELISEENTVETLAEDEDLSIPSSPASDACRLVVELLSYITGCAHGRWDVRFATGERTTPELPDPFAPLPVCSPGMLIGNDGLPPYETSPEYPLNINWEGILVDDQDHLDDIVWRVQDVLRIIWQDRAEGIEQEACQILGVRELREYFRKPGNGGFWMDHVKRYSKSRRKAPIYWLLQSSKKNYALWLYYHRLDKDTLFKALTKYAEPKIRLEDSRLEQWRAQLAAAGSEGREVKQLERQMERQESLVAELYDFRDKLRRAADLNLEPDLDDGVVLNIAPLRELVPWSEAKKYWDELLTGKYEWSSISKQLRSKGVI